MKAWNVFAVLTGFLLLTGCAAQDDLSGSPGTAPEILVFSSSEEGVEDFRKLCEEQNLPHTCPYGEGRISRITPEETAAEHGFSLYKCGLCCDTWLEYQGEVRLIGCGFGGWGVTSCAVADLDGNGSEEICYTFSYGSGIHRSEAGVFDTAAKTETVLPVVYWDEDMVLSAEEGRLCLCSSVIHAPLADGTLAETGEIIGTLCPEGQGIGVSIPDGSPLERTEEQ